MLKKVIIQALNVLILSLFFVSSSTAQTIEEWIDIFDRFTRFELVPAETHYANLIIHNGLIREESSPVPTGEPYEFTLSIEEGIPVTIVYTSMRSTEPDRFEVYAPPGYRATPWNGVIEENDFVIIRIDQYLGG